MNRYFIPVCLKEDENLQAPLGEVAIFQQSTYTPKTVFSVSYLPDKGFIVRMTCQESNPKADETVTDGDVYKDSCMECFLNFAPEKGDNYINMELNAKGTLHCKFGPGRHDRKPLSAFGAPMPKVTTTIKEDSWSINCLISNELIKTLFGKESFSSGDIIKGNFYKCGDKTASPHYGMWNEVISEKPDFHRPEFFGELIIK